MVSARRSMPVRIAASQLASGGVNIDVGFAEPLGGCVDEGEARYLPHGRLDFVPKSIARLLLLESPLMLLKGNIATLRGTPPAPPVRWIAKCHR